MAYLYNINEYNIMLDYLLYKLFTMKLISRFDTPLRNIFKNKKLPPFQSPTTVINQDLTSLCFFPSMILLWNDLSKGSNSYQVFKCIIHLIVTVLYNFIDLSVYFLHFPLKLYNIGEQN